MNFNFSLSNLKAASTIRRALSVLGIFAMGACSADGCSCTQPTPGGFPSADRVDNGIQVRITPDALAQIEADPAALLGSFLGTDDGSFPLPASCGGDPEICCDNGMPVEPCGPVNIDLVPQGGDAPRMEINTTNGNGHLQIIARARVTSAADIAISTNGQDCDVSIDTTNAGNESIEIVIDLDLLVDAATNTSELANVNVVVNDLSTNDFDIDGGIICELADALLKGTIRDQLLDALSGILEETISDLSCKSCPSGNISDCGEFADACDDEICMRGGSCLQELGLAGRIIADQAFAGFSTGQLGALDIYEVAGGYSENTAGGISLGVLSGMAPAGTPRDRCGPASAGAPPTPAIARSPFFSGNLRPDTNNPFGVGIGVHQHNLDLFAWSAYESGLLCLNIGPQTSDFLSAETFALIMPSLLNLAHQVNAPVVLGLRPQSPPIFTLGAGTTLENGDIDDPLITLAMPGLEIDFMSLIDDQWIRVMTLVSDVELPINLEADENGTLTPVIGADMAFQNVSVINATALTESPAELAESFPLILDLALPMLAGDLALELPLLGSLQLAVQADGITSIENNSMLAIFADLAVAAPRIGNSDGNSDGNNRERAQTRAQVRSVNLAEGATEVILDLDGDAPAGGSLEWSYRLNGGMWSTYSRERERTIARASLGLQGMHTIEVRARELGTLGTLDQTPVALHVPVDGVPPRVKVAHGLLGGPVAIALDHVDKTGVVVEYRDASGEWKLAGSVNEDGVISIDPREISGSENDIEVRATDSAGNVSTFAGVLAFHGSGGGQGCNCQSSGSSSGLTALLIMLAVLFVGGFGDRFARVNRETIRRVLRRGTQHGKSLMLIVALTAISSVVSACSCGSSSAPCGDRECMEGEVERGSTGRWMSMAATADRVVFAGYDELLGDLVVADLIDGELQYVAVDGIPRDLDATFEPSTYRDGIAEAGANVGAWTSVVLADGAVQVAYQDRDAKALKFARQQGPGADNRDYAIIDVDTDTGVETGLYSSLTLAGGAPSIAYLSIGGVDGSGRKISQLKVATANSPSPNASSDFDISVVEELAISCAGICETGLDCVVADPDIGEACTAPTSDCTATCSDTESCVAGTCLDIAEASTVYDLPLGTGLFINHLTLADGRLAIVYYRRQTGDLVAATLDGSSWTVTDLDGASNTDVGASAAAILGSDGLVHVAYQDAIGDRVMYLAWDGNTIVAGPEVVDDGVRDGDDRAHSVGAGMAISVSGSEVIIAYQDGLTSSQVISQGSTGSWARSENSTAAHLVGFFNALGTGLGSTWAASYTVDPTERRPGNIVVNTVP